MTGLLLDTNIVIAIVNELIDRLPGDLRSEVVKPTSEHFVSVVSVWEMAIKNGSGKLALEVPVEHVGAALGALGMTILPINLNHVVAVAKPEPATRDPFDRLLLGICAVEGMRLVTTDRALRDHALAYRP